MLRTGLRINYHLPSVPSGAELLGGIEESQKQGYVNPLGQILKTVPMKRGSPQEGPRRSL
jgi:hypothetical protein